MSMTQEEEELVVNSIRPYPLEGVWTTPSEVPVGVVVYDLGDGKVKQSQINTDAVFTGTPYLTIPTAQIITADYQCFFESELTPNIPTEAYEMFYGVDSTRFNLRFESDGEVGMFGNGVVESTTVGSWVNNVKTKIKLEKKIGSVRVTVDGNVFETSVTWDSLSWPSYTVGSRGGSFIFSGTISYFKGISESWNFKDESLVGSQGTTAVETGTLGFNTYQSLVPL